MKLNNKSKILLAIIAVIFVVFNVIFFLVADSTNIKNATTIISWVFMILGFASFLLFSYLSESKNGMKNLVFMRFTLLGHCAIYLVVDFVLAVFFTVLGSYVEVSLAWCIVVQLVALAIHVLIALACLLAKTSAEEVGAEVKQKTSRMKGFRVDAQMLVEYCTDADAKKDFLKFAEAVRYSDPMSCDALTEIENDLEQIIAEMKHLLMSNDIETAQNKCKIANNILKERNQKCQMFK